MNEDRLKNKLIYTFLLVIVNIYLLDSYAQERADFAEKYRLYTNNEFYAAGEKIHLKVYLDHGGPQQLSKIIYVNLVDKLGESVSKNKLFVSEKTALGEIVIPEELNSGYYSLYVYSKWQKNFGSENYLRKRLFIINTKTGISSKFKFTKKKDTSFIVRERQNDVSKINQLKVKSDKRIYGKREKVNLKINTSTNSFFNADLTVSVKRILDNKNSYSSENIASLEKSPIEIEYLPEVFGAYLSGTLIEKKSSSPLSNVVMFITCMDSARTTKIVNTDDNGDFLVPFSTGKGVLKLIFQPIEVEKRTKLIFNDDFEENFPKDELSDQIDKKSLPILTRVMLNYQIEKQFLEETESVLEITKPLKMFYGKADSSYLLKNYIDLPTMEEVFNNIIMDVLVKKTKQNYNLAIYDRNKRKLNFQPLLLIDGLPIIEVGTLLKINPLELERIEVINSNFLIGNTLFGGVVSLFSKKSDYAGVKMPINSKVINYLLPSDKKSNIAKIQKVDFDNTHFPYFKNMIYWNPEVKIKGNEEKQVSFFATDETGKFLINVEGVNDYGVPIKGQCIYEVRN